MTDRKRLWPRVRRVWMVTGLTATAIFVTWSLVAYRAQPAARRSQGPIVSPSRPETVSGRFVRNRRLASAAVPPRGAGRSRRLRALIASRVAEAGHTVLLMRLPRRGAFGGAGALALFVRARQAMRPTPGVSRWVIAGQQRILIDAIPAFLASAQAFLDPSCHPIPDT